MEQEPNRIPMFNNLLSPHLPQTHVGGSRFLPSGDVPNEQKTEKSPTQSTDQPKVDVSLTDWGEWSTQISRVKNQLPCPPVKD